MSRRYGRNQKRRAREQIAALAAESTRLAEAEAMSRGLAEHLSRKAAELRSEIERAKRMLPEGSVLFGPGKMSLDGVPCERIRAQTRLPINVEFIGAEAVPMSQCGIVELDLLLTETVVDQMRDQLHFDVKFADGRWCYSISRKGLHRFNRRDLVSTISMALAKQMTADLAAKGLVR